MGLTRTVHRTLGMGPTAPHIPLSMLSSLPHGPTAQPVRRGPPPASWTPPPVDTTDARGRVATPACIKRSLRPGHSAPTPTYPAAASHLPVALTLFVPAASPLRACLTNMASIAGSSALSFARPVKVILLRSEVASATCCSLVSPDPSLSRPAFCVAHGRGLGGLIRFPACDACA